MDHDYSSILELEKNKEMWDKKIARQTFMRKCKEKAAIKIMESYWYEKIINEPSLLFDKFIPENDRIDVIKYVENVNEIRGRKYKYYLVTINPKEDIKLEDFKKKIEKCVKKVWIENWMYCYEWRNENIGLHCHIKLWIGKAKKPSEVRREIFNTFKHLVGNKQHVNLRPSNTDGCFEKYIYGWKKGERKPNYKHDCEYRELNKLYHVYHKIEPKTLDKFFE